jgi:uncharacterized radical SAM superfamily protein
MPGAIPETSQSELEKDLGKARATSWKNLGKRIHFYSPSFSHRKSSRLSFPSISITGNSCSLNCLHCQGIVLKTMISASTPKKLIEVCRRLKEEGGVGCLISGGCTPAGIVPLDDFVDAIAQIKKELGLTIVVHTGIIEEGTAERLKTAGVDAALIDVIGSDETLKQIYHIRSGVESFAHSLKALSEAKIPLVPHVLVGLHFGQLRGEAKALEMVSRYNPAAVIVISFFPIKGTALEGTAPPKPEDIARVFIASRNLMPKTPLVLGCMRPSGMHRIRTDNYAVESGVNAIAFPTDEAVQLARNLGLNTFFSPECCSMIYRDILRKSL